jgi:uncharacterized protein YbjT (DUF2867 family)
VILVIGAGGTIGSALLERLRAWQHPVRAACHSQRSAAGAAARGADVAMIDLADPVTLGPALDGVDSVFLLSATGPRQTRQELNVLAAAEAAATVEQIVKLSVWRADELLTPIARLHRPVEEGAGGVRRGLDVLAPELLHAELRAANGGGDQERGRDPPT